MEKILIVYWSASGSTKAMAEAMAEALSTHAIIKEVSTADVSDISEYDKIMLGCPAMGDEILEESEFQPFYDHITSQLADKKIALFGSFGWGDGQWMRDWQKSVEETGATLFEEALIINDYPNADGIETCKAFAQRFLNA